MQRYHSPPAAVAAPGGGTASCPAVKQAVREQQAASPPSTAEAAGGGLPLQQEGGMGWACAAAGSAPYSSRRQQEQEGTAVLGGTPGGCYRVGVVCTPCRGVEYGVSRLGQRLSSLLQYVGSIPSRHQLDDSGCAVGCLGLSRWWGQLEVRTAAAVAAATAVGGHGAVVFVCRVRVCAGRWDVQCPTAPYCCCCPWWTPPAALQWVLMMVGACLPQHHPLVKQLAAGRHCSSRRAGECCVHGP